MLQTVRNDESVVQPIAQKGRQLPPQRLREQVRLGAKNRPGIYRFIGPRGEVLYVGKSVRVRSRLLSYFRSDVPSKQSELLRVAQDVEWDYAPNEFEALLQEFRQIRALRPRFNRRHRGERRFAWIRLTEGAAPRLVATRRPRPSHARHFGPFPAPPKLPALLRELSVCVGLRDCASGMPMHLEDQEELFAVRREPRCSRVELDTCLGPCAARCSAADYREIVLQATQFLDGKTDSPLDRLLSRMESAAAAKEFESAAKLRDREERLRSLRDRVVLFRKFLAELSFLYRIPSAPLEPDRAYVLSCGRVVCSFNIEQGSDASSLLQDRVRTALARPTLKPDAMDAATQEEIFLVARWFQWKPEERERAIPFERLFAGASFGP